MFLMNQPIIKKKKITYAKKELNSQSLIKTVRHVKAKSQIVVLHL